MPSRSSIVLSVILQYDDDIEMAFATLHEAEVFARRYLPLLPDKVWDVDPEGGIVNSYDIVVFGGQVRLLVTV